MRGTFPATAGILSVMLAGLLFPEAGNGDDGVVYAGVWGLLAIGLFGVLAGGIAIGTQLARRP